MNIRISKKAREEIENQVEIKGLHPKIYIRAFNCAGPMYDIEFVKELNKDAYNKIAVNGLEVFISKDLFKKVRSISIDYKWRLINRDFFLKVDEFDNTCKK